MKSFLAELKLSLKERDLSRECFIQLGNKYCLTASSAPVSMASAKWSVISACGELTFLMIPILKEFGITVLERGISFIKNDNDVNHAFLLVKTCDNEEIVIDPFLRESMLFSEYLEHREYYFFLGFTEKLNKTQRSYSINTIRQEVPIVDEGINRVNEQINILLKEAKKQGKTLKICSKNPCQILKNNTFSERIKDKVITHPQSGWLDGCEQPRGLPM